MNTNYISPSIEVIEIEVEDAILGMSKETSGITTTNINDGGSAW